MADVQPATQLSEEAMISTSRKMFIGGFFFLPFLWLVNFLYFMDVVRKPSTPALLKKYVWGSLIGSILWLVPLITWYTIYVCLFNDWGATGDAISITIPKG